MLQSWGLNELEVTEQLKNSNKVSSFCPDQIRDVPRG